MGRAKQTLRGQTKIISLFNPNDPFILENGQMLKNIKVAYETYGHLNKTRDNAVLVCHALTGDAHAAGHACIDKRIRACIPFYATKQESDAGWWDGLIGYGKTLDTDRYFVVSSNILGSCYGTTGPAHENDRYSGTAFPEITVRDMVRVQKRLLEHLGVSRLLMVIGGSLGGMQALEWALMYPESVRSIVPIATAARHSAWAIGFSHLMRRAITGDPVFNKGHYSKQPEQGLSLARQIGMISYRTDISFQDRFGRKKYRDNPEALFDVESYLNYQGKKLADRFDANSMLTLLRAMDLHDIGYKRNGVLNALASIKIPILCIGINSDILYPAHEQRAIASAIPGAVYREIISPYGHDAFLIEFEQLNLLINDFLTGAVHSGPLF